MIERQRENRMNVPNEIFSEEAINVITNTHVSLGRLYSGDNFDIIE
jgi:hypothetical protein